MGDGIPLDVICSGKATLPPSGYTSRGWPTDLPTSCSNKNSQWQWPGLTGSFCQTFSSLLPSAVLRRGLALDTEEENPLSLLKQTLVPGQSTGGNRYLEERRLSRRLHTAAPWTFWASPSSVGGRRIGLLGALRYLNPAGQAETRLSSLETAKDDLEVS